MQLFPLILVLFFLSNLHTCSGENIAEKDGAVNSFLRNHFGKRLNQASKIVTINKDVFFSLLLETADSSTALKKMKTFWPFHFESYYDTMIETLNIHYFFPLCLLIQRLAFLLQ